MVNKILMSGNEAVVRAAVKAGCRFFAGYPISPSSEITEQMAREMPLVGGIFLQMEDEIGSIAAILGASLAGAKAMTATSGPGFSLMQENLGFGYMAEIPAVIVDVQRGGPSTGLPTQPAQGDIMQTAWGTHGDHPVVVFYPSSVEETFHDVIRAFNWSERLRTPVIVLMDESIGHLTESVALPENVELWERKMPDAPPGKYMAYKAGEDDVPVIPPFGKGYRFHVTGLYHDEEGFPTQDPELVSELINRLKRKVLRVRKELELTEFYMTDDAELVIISFGSAFRSSLRAARLARKEGLKVGVIKLRTIWPSPEDTIRELSNKVEAFLVVEMNLMQYYLEVKRILEGTKPVYFLGEVTGLPIHPFTILKKIKEVYKSEQANL